MWNIDFFFTLSTVVLDCWVAGGELIEDEQAEESDNMDMTDD